jgi:hypothetical protein
MAHRASEEYSCVHRSKVFAEGLEIKLFLFLIRQTAFLVMAHTSRSNAVLLNLLFYPGISFTLPS